MLSKCNKIMHNSEGINATNCKDRLSELPDEVIVHILSFLPTVDAIRTMLIRCFRNLWTFVPTLKFDLDAYTNGMIRLNRCDDLWTINPLFGSEIQEYYDIHYSSDSDSGVIFWVFPRFSRFVRNVLTLHKGPTIDTFHISIDQFPDDLFVQDVIDDVQTWLTFAIDKGVQNLNFDFDSHDAIIPQCVFTSHSLVTLSLSDVKLEDQTQVHLRNLRKLSLFCVCGSDRAFQQLISGCPSLLELTIDNAIGMQILNVTSQSVSKLFLGVEDDPIALNTPALKMLDVVYPSSSSSYLLKVIDVSSLQEVNAKNLPCYGDQVTTFFSQFLSVEVFTLSHHSFSRLSLINTDYPQNRWKRLVLHPCWYNVRCVQIIFGLVAASVELEDLVIHSGYSSGNGKTRFIRPEISTCVMPLLKTVTIHRKENCLVSQLKIVELLLANTIVLEKMVINFEKKQVTAVEENNFVEQVSRFRKASTNATVVFA